MSRASGRAVLTLVAVAVALCLGPIAALLGQPAPAPPQQPTFRTGVNLVRVDVTVTGRGDEPVADLQASDFEIREDDVRRRLKRSSS